MSESGDKLGAAYRALPRGEPRAAIDDAILAASRRALAKPSASRRWAAPMSIAAVLVLAFGVTMNMREEKPGVESPEVYSAPAAPPPLAAAPESSAKSAEVVPEAPAKPAKKVAAQAKPDATATQALDIRERKDLAQQVAPAEAPMRKEADQNRAAAAPAAVTAAAAPPAAAAGPPPQALARMKREAPTAQGFASADAQMPVDAPTRELEAIAKLRVEGRHEEADKALAEFRRTRPDYRIAEAMWERVKPR